MIEDDLLYYVSICKDIDFGQFESTVNTILKGKKLKLLLEVFNLSDIDVKYHL